MSMVPGFSLIDKTRFVPVKQEETSPRQMEPADVCRMNQGT